MADQIEFSGQIRRSNLPLPSSFHALDPISLLLYQNSGSAFPATLKLTTERFVMERGPRYRLYADLRESKLRMKNSRYRDVEEQEKIAPPAKKQVKFLGHKETVRKRSSAVAQSVPDFSAVLRKENRRPPATLSPVMEMTPPAKTWSKNNGSLTNTRGSKSASAGEKRAGAGGLMVRKSCASFEELKGFSSAAAKAINGENRRGGRTTKTILGTRHL